MAYAQMAEDTAKGLTGSHERWTAFLTTAARVYKYPYTEQLMIFAQRPDATACAEYGLWTNTMRRYVRRGSKGIALIDTSGPDPRIRYVFDVSDTGGRADSRTPNLWKMEDRHVNEVAAMLQSEYGADEPLLDQQFDTVAIRLAAQYWEEHKRDILGIVDGSFLAEYDEYNVGAAFRQAASVSITYMLMSRCGMNPENQFGHEEFMSIFDFNTPQAVAVLGTAVSEIGQRVLRQIEVTIRNAERRLENERNDEQPDLSAGRGRAAAQREPGRNGNEAPGQVRQDAEEVPSGESARVVQFPGVQREAAITSAGDRGNSQQQAGTNDGRNEGESGPDREAESRESNAVGGPDERPESPGRGNPDGGTDLQLTEKLPEETATPTTEQSAAETAEEQEASAVSSSKPEQAVFNLPEMGTEQTSLFGSIDGKPEPVDAAPVPHGLQYPQEIIDAALTIGANDMNSRKYITAYFMKDKSSTENAIFLRDHYKTNGAGFYVRDQQYAIWYDASGIRLSAGTSAQRNSAYLITWEQAALRIRELLDQGRYIPSSELQGVSSLELSELGERLLHLYGDIDSRYDGMHFLPTIGNVYNTHSGYPEMTAKMVELLRQPPSLHNLEEEMRAFLNTYAQNRDILRFHYHRPRQYLTSITDLQRKPLSFTVAPDYDPQRRFFISDDEIDHLLRGRQDDHDYRLRVYSFFLANTESKAREAYMKNVHGQYSGSYTGNNNTLYTSKGLSFSHGAIGAPYAGIDWTWSKVARRIGELIQANRFLTDDDRAAMPDYEREQVARQIVSAMEDAPEYIPRPFTGNAIGDYWENVRQVQEQLTDPERVQAIHDSLLSLSDMTLPDSRYYAIRHQALDTVKAYQQGTFSLFGEKREPILVEPSKQAVTERQEESRPEPPLQPASAPASYPRTMAQADIDEALQEWNGSAESKRTVVAYMREHGREREAAAWLRQEYGDDLPAYPVHGHVGAEGDLSWTRVQRSILRLIQEDRFFTDEEKEQIASQSVSETEEKQLETEEKATDSPAPMEEAEHVTPGGTAYHVGDELDWDVDGDLHIHLRVERVDAENVWCTFLEDNATEPNRLDRTGFEAQIDNGRFTPVLAQGQEEEIIPDTEPTPHAAQEAAPLTAEETVSLPLSAEAAAEYSDLKARYPNALIGFEQHGIFEFYGEDAERAAQILHAKMLTKDIPGGHVSVTGFPADRWQSFFRQLWRKGNDVYLAGEKADGTHEETKFLYARDFLPVNAVVHIRERAYRIDRVDFDRDSVRLLDITGDGDPRFPPTLEESTDYVRSFLEEEPLIPVSEETKTEINIPAPTREETMPEKSQEPPAPRMMETVVELTDQGYQITETRPVREYQYDCMFHDIAYLDGQAYQVEKIGLFDVTFQPLETENIYPVARVESMERLETLLAQDDRNSHLLRTSTLEQRQQVIDSWKQKTAQYKISQQNDVFEFQGYHFEPVGVFSQEMSFSDISRGTVSHTELNMSDAPDALHPYSHTRFYDAAHDVKADVFRCLETGKLYMPGDHELFEYVGDYEPFLQQEKSLDSSPIREAHENTDQGTSQQTSAENFRISDDHLGEGGAKTKFRNNMAAIYTMKTLEAEGRPATHEEQEVMSKYVGWGGLANAFDETKQDWSKEYAELKEALTPEEYTAARSSTLNAHYTSPTVIRAIYEALGNMGFKTGNILEPAMGVGNFFGMLPEEMRSSKLYGVELDSITGRIAKQLYPQADITVAGFETTDRRDFFDVAVGNVPFGNYKVNDRAYNKLGFNIHNYFFAKALDQVRPGGIVAFVTSRYTMDAKSPEVRKYLAQRAELLGAIRLPSNAFTANAGTEVTTDIIFLQKRDRPIDIEPDWVHLGETEDGIPINSYYVEHPDMVLGTMVWEDKMYGYEKETACQPIPGADLGQQLSEAVQRITGTYQEAELPELAEGEEIDDSIPADPAVPNFSYTVVNGNVYYRENSRMVRPKLSQTAQERTAGMVELRDCVRQLMNAQLENASDADIHALQERLNTLYDAYTAKYGLINSRGNALAFADDSSYYLLCSLEMLDENGNLERKADMFTKRTIRQQQVVDHVDTAVEALAVSIAERAKVDLPYMAYLTGKGEDEIASELTGVIFRLPEAAGKDGRSRYVTADEYLSGNVRQKLRIAQSWAESDDSFQVNVKALEGVQPQDLSASEIDVRLGATWIDKKYIQQFMYETFNTPRRNRWNDYIYASNRYAVTVNFSPLTAEWNITNKRTIPGIDVAAYRTFGTERASAYDLLEAALNLRDVKIYDKIYDVNGKETRVLNQKETTLAQQKQQSIKDAFREWIWKDPERREDLVREYNERFNSTRPREFDGSHISFAGMNPEINLRSHQRNAIAHILYGGNTLLAHEVGAGKTFEMAAAAMESKRLGLCSKPMFVVPNHLTEQWASEFLRLYPSAKILVAKKKDFEKKNRKKFCARIATGDYDAVIIGHSQFEKIPVSYARQEHLLQDQIEEILLGIEEAKANRGDNFSIKQMERSRKQLEARLEKLRAEHKKDDVVTFEELGVDRLYVDEGHFFKNLFCYTKMTNVAGLSTAEAQKSSDMFMKCRYMDEITDSRGIVFATGTPVSNSMVELYTMQRYLQYETLRQKGMTHFDCWASTFGETVTALELAPEGTGYRARTRFAKFFNLPELMNMFKEVADIKTADQLNLPTPEAHYETIAVQPSEIQQKLVQSLSERAAAVHGHIVDPSVDNMLKITSDGRKLGLDQRLIDPMLPDHPGSKVNVCVDNVFRIWQEGQADKLTQLVFCDLSTPRSSSSSRAAPAQRETEKESAPTEEQDKSKVEKTVGDEEKTEAVPEPEPIIQNLDQFSVYDDIRAKLIEKGIPAEEIAFIHDANTEVKKKELFAKVRSGQVRVLMGSTAKMGAGTNAQDRLIALHDLDAPWRPGDLEQRAGRIVRQGNKNKDVYIYRYVTEKSFDAYLWQTLENKQKFISQIMTSKSPVRSCEDVDETALSYAEIKALCAGDPRIKEKMDLDIEVARLRVMKADHDSKRYSLEDQIRKEFPRKINECQHSIEGLQHDLERLAAHPVPEKEFAGMTVDGSHYAEKKDAGAAIIEFCKKHYTIDRIEMGEYRGFPMTLQYDAFNKEFEVTLQGEMTHRVTLGSDLYGNIQRIDNALSGIQLRINGVKSSLENYEEQLKAAEEEVKKPFPQEEELREKSAKLAELNAELNIDGQRQSHQETEKTDNDDRVAKRAPSILARLQKPCPLRADSVPKKQYDMGAR